MSGNELNDTLNTPRDQDAEFFQEAFTDPVTRKPYDIPPSLRICAERICRAYGINGACDPMYIANVIAAELGLGNGQSSFYQKRFYKFVRFQGKCWKAEDVMRDHRGYMSLTNLQDSSQGVLVDPSLVHPCSREDEDAINYFLNKKA